MVFSSYIFLIVFLPIVLVGYYLLSYIKNPFWQKLFLIGASLYFYGYYNVRYLLLIVVSMLINYAVALLIQRMSATAVTPPAFTKRLQSCC